MDEFSENFRMGGGHFRSKKFHCIFFAFETAFFVMNFQKNFKKGGRVISDLKNFIAILVFVEKLQYIFGKRPGGS